MTFWDSILNMTGQRDQRTKTVLVVGGTEAQQRAVVRSLRRSQGTTTNPFFATRAAPAVEPELNVSSACLGYTYVEYKDELDANALTSFLNVYSLAGKHTKYKTKFLRKFQQIDPAELFVIVLGEEETDLARWLRCLRDTIPSPDAYKVRYDAYKTEYTDVSSLPATVRDVALSDEEGECASSIGTHCMIISDMSQQDKFGSTILNVGEVESLQVKMRLIALYHGASLMLISKESDFAEVLVSVNRALALKIHALLKVRANHVPKPVLNSYESLFVPVGWDSWGKIASATDTPVDCAGIVAQWSAKLEEEEHEEPQTEERVVTIQTGNMYHNFLTELYTPTQSYAI